jgi:O-acetylserine/cysteine efflux transporter
MKINKLMPLPHLFLAVLVAIIWGVNFIFVTLSLEEVPPILLCSLRFLFASIPAVFFIKFPTAPIRVVVLYGLIMFALQFGLLFTGMQSGMTPGMASMILQVQVFFSMFFAAIFLNEKPSPWQISGAMVSFTGIVLIATHFDSNLSLVSFFLILAAAATWGIGNLLTKKAGNSNMIALVVWGSFFAFLPMLILSFIMEGPERITASYQNVTWVGIASLSFIVYGSTWIGYGLWNWLLSRYPVGMVAPFTLLVPIVGMVSSALLLGESLQLWKLIAATLVIGGLGISLLGARLYGFLALRFRPPNLQKI